MSTTTRLALPYIAPQQAQKQVTYNEAMSRLDQLVQPAVLSRTLTVPPGSPAEGDSYIVAPSATGAWSGKDGQLASWRDGGWEFIAPGAGWMAYVADAGAVALYEGGIWTDLIAADSFEDGVWTPALQFGGAATGITYATQLGRYTRIGRQVTVTARIVLTSKGAATGSARIAGLPFASRNDGLAAALAVGYSANLAGVTGTLAGEVDANSAAASLYQSPGGAAVPLTAGEFTDTTNLSFTATYDAA